MSGLLPEPVFVQRLPKDILEEGDLFSPQFNEQGLIPAITIDADTAETLMFAWMNEEALKCTLRTGEAWYWSRSRGELWHKGATSGQIQEVIELRTDCDQDVVLLKVRPRSPGACHVGYNSCFFRSVHMNSDGTVKLSFEENEKIAK
ncbi:MAG: phosphoribosyl-AMP cyclohydrolase [Pseudomonadota bacterium]|nr:phosphoribosyl-AMP cyclohydrolase [Pseudomonadota bacterium]